jgi:hypothetical protein
MAVLLGDTATGANSANSNAQGDAFATRLQCIESGTVTSVWLRAGATVPTAANTHWAIYSDAGGGVPVTRLTADFSGTAATVNTYSSFAVSPGLDVTSGSFYWIAFLAANAGGVAFSYTDFATSGGDSSDWSASLNALGTPWSQTAGFANIINMRAEGTTVAPPAAETLIVHHAGIRTS